MFLKFLQNSQENTNAGPATELKREFSSGFFPICEIFKSTFSMGHMEHLRWQVLQVYLHQRINLNTKSLEIL